MLLAAHCGNGDWHFLNAFFALLRGNHNLLDTAFGGPGIQPEQQRSGCRTRQENCLYSPHDLSNDSFIFAAGALYQDFAHKATCSPVG
jgi:hypothetical protein